MTTDPIPNEVADPFGALRIKMAEAIRGGKKILVTTDRVYTVEKDGSRRLLHKMRSKDIRRYVKYEGGIL